MTDERKPKTPGMAEASPKLEHDAEAATTEEAAAHDPMLVLRAERQGLIAEVAATPEDEDAALWPRLQDVEKRILTAEPQTLLGALVQIEVLASMADEGLPEFATEIIAGMNEQIPARIERLLATSFDDPGDAVVALRQRWENVRAERDQLKIRDDNDPNDPGLQEDKRLYGVQCDIEESIANTPTHTAAGVAVKLRQLQRDDEEFDGMGSWRPAAFRTALAALDQDTLPTVEDPILVLKREWEARYKALDEQRDTGDDSDEARQPFYDRLDETENQILQTPATTLAGVIVKLVLWARLHCKSDVTKDSFLSWNRTPMEEFPSDQRQVASAMHDLERMSQGIAPSTIKDPVTDEPLLELERRMLAAEAAIDKGGEKLPKAFHDEWTSLQDRVAEMPAISIAGLAVKLRLMRANTAFLDAHEFGDKLIESTIESVERLAGERRGISESTPPRAKDVSSDGSIVALALRLPDLRKAADEIEEAHLHGADTKEEGKAAYQVVDDMEDRITDMMARTLQDALAQVIVAYHFVATGTDNAREGLPLQSLLKAEKLLYSIRAVLEREAGLDPAELFDAKGYMPDSYNQHLPGCKRAGLECLAGTGAAMSARQYSPLDVETVAINIETVVATLQMVIEGLPQDGRVGDIPDVLALCRNHLSDQQRELEKITESGEARS